MILPKLEPLPHDPAITFITPPYLWSICGTFLLRYKEQKTSFLNDWNASLDNHRYFCDVLLDILIIIIFIIIVIIIIISLGH